MIIARRKRFFRGTLANFYECKKCIIFNVDFRPVSKKSKVDMTLIRHSPFKCTYLASTQCLIQYRRGLRHVRRLHSPGR